LKLETLLNEQQLEAVKHKDGPLLILAGAGSGKTRVITYRIAYLISEYKIKPENILAVTFTNKAADEMKHRIKLVVGSLAENILMSTFHSFGCRVLRKHAQRMGYTNSFSIFDEDDRERLVKECMHEARVSEKEMKPYKVITMIQDIKNQLMTPKQYENDFSNTIEGSAVSKIYTLYEDKLKHNNAFDFDDLIIKPIKLFKEFPDILELFRERFKYILIDEYQDINNSQYVLISLLAEKYKNICVVGDDDQSIYRFRGADITNILGFEEDYKNTKVIRLEQNYRSTKNILKAAHSVIKNNKERKDKELWSKNEDGEKIIFYYANDEGDEAEFVINEAAKMLSRTGITLKDMAVFYRTNAQSRILEDKFRRAGMPYKLIGGTQFYARMEIKDLIAYLRIVSNPYDVISFKRIINVPPRGIGDTTISKIQDYTFTNNMTLFDGLKIVDEIADIKDSAKASLKQLYGFIKNLNEKKDTMKPSDTLKTLLVSTGYLEYWQTDTSVKAKDRVENIKELVSALAEYEDRSSEASLQDFLGQVALMTDFDKWDKDADAITLMTLHSAKGLEFDAVFIVGMDEYLFPHKNCIEEPGGIEEERRLCYVGITRAKKKLYLLSAIARRQFGTKKISVVSRFINEIPSELLEYKGRMPVKAVQEKYMTNGDIVDAINDVETEYLDMPAEIEIPYKPGEKVRHKKMGTGTIIKVEPYGDDLRLTINFKTHGKKIISAKYGGLEKI